MKIHSLLATFAAATLFSASAVAQNSVTSSGDGDDATAGGFGGDMNVMVNVAEVCRIGSQDVDFGNIDATQSTDVTVPVAINALCPTNTTYTIELDYGVNGTGTGTATQRRLTGGDGSGDFLDYKIFQPTAGGTASSSTPLWGTGAGAGYESTGTGAKQTFQANAVLNLSTGGSTGGRTPGLYTDLVTLTLTY